MPVIWQGERVTTVWNGRPYTGTIHDEGGQLHLSSAYGSKKIPFGKRDFDRIEAGRRMLEEIVKARAR